MPMNCHQQPQLHATIALKWQHANNDPTDPFPHSPLPWINPTYPTQYSAWWWVDHASSSLSDCYLASDTRPLPPIVMPSQHLTTISNTQQHTTINTPTNATTVQPPHKNHNNGSPWLSSAINHEPCQQTPKTTTIWQPTEYLHNNGKWDLPGPSHPLDSQSLPTYSTGSGLPKQSHGWLIAYIDQLNAVHQPATQANSARSKTYYPKCTIGNPNPTYSQYYFSSFQFLPLTTPPLHFSKCFHFLVASCLSEYHQYLANNFCHP